MYRKTIFFPLGKLHTVPSAETLLFCFCRPCYCLHRLTWCRWLLMPDGPPSRSRGSPRHGHRVTVAVTHAVTARTSRPRPGGWAEHAQCGSDQDPTSLPRSDGCGPHIAHHVARHRGVSEEEHFLHHSDFFPAPRPAPARLSHFSFSPFAPHAVFFLARYKLRRLHRIVMYTEASRKVGPSLFQCAIFWSGNERDKLVSRKNHIMND